MPEEEPAFFATTARGLEGLLADELRLLGAPDVRESRSGVHFGGNIETAYRACLWSRLASRVLLVLARAEIESAEELYRCARTIPWAEHIRLANTFAVDAVAHGSPVRDGRYAGLLIKDAIVDTLREIHDARPNVDRRHPDLRFNASLIGRRVVIALDLAGESLHRRGYRGQTGSAPLKENLAFALALRSGWTPEAEGLLLDPLCGSGTILIEAGLAAARMAPGLLREHFGFESWPQHDAALWARLRHEAQEARRVPERIRCLGYDSEARVLEKARENARRAGVDEFVRFERRALVSAPLVPETRFVATNPPYGLRQGAPAEVVKTYAELGAFLKQAGFPLRAIVLTASPETLPQLRLRATRKYQLYNGALPCVGALFDLHARPETETLTAPLAKPTLGHTAQEFQNRLRKNAHRIVRWARREGLEAFRVYDADLPAYNAAIDVYGDWLVVSEYRAPGDIDPNRAAGRLQDILLLAPEVLEIDAARVVLRQRRRTRGTDQYEKLDSRRELFAVREYDARFLVNLHDYLDTGLFCDHRLVRRKIQSMAAGRRFLNLYGYTGTASVSAALGGAESTTTVDLSRTYLEWAERNLRENRIPQHGHRRLQAECMEFLERSRDQFDLIFVNPPPFSTSKKMRGTFDVQRDHVLLLRAVRRLVAPGGEVIFSTGLHNFVANQEELGRDYRLKDISRSTLPLDFERSKNDHHVWLLTPAA